MLSMTPAEIRLRRGSLLIWIRYSFSDRYDMTRTQTPVRLLAKVCEPTRRDDFTTASRLRVIVESTGKMEDVDAHFLIDPTRMKKP